MRPSLFLLITALFIDASTFAQADSNKVFLASKGTWKFPVTNGYVINANQASTVMTIGTDSAAEVHAVFDGLVTMVDEYDSLFLVVVKYGDYFVGYSNLEATGLKKGDRLKKNDVVGYAGKNLDDVYGIDFRLSTRDHELDPVKWFFQK